MKQIVYENGGGTSFVLTNYEFFEAQKAWAVKRPYWCARLEASFSPRFLYAKTPNREFGKKVFVSSIGKNLRKFFLKGKSWYELMPEFDMQVNLKTVDEVEKFQSILIDQEEYYNRFYNKQPSAGQINAQANIALLN